MYPKRQQVNFTYLKNKPIGHFEYYDLFKYRAEKGYKILQRICFWILTKLGCFETKSEAVPETVTVTFDPAQILDTLLEQRHLVYRDFHEKPKTVLMGPEEFRSLNKELRDKDFNFPISFHIKAPYRDYTGYNVLDLNIRMIPWMKGVLVF